MLRFIDLTKIYRTDQVETVALDRFSLEIAAGEFVAVMGESGSGKSTFLSIAGLIDRPTEGRYEFLGTDVSRAPERKLAALRKAHIGFIFQSFNLIDDLSVARNVELPLIYAGVARPQRVKRVHEVLELVGMAHRRDHLPRQLSGGQQQRVAVARAVVHTPDLLLADEPTGNLDTENSQEILALLQALNEAGTTVVMVTHSPAQAEAAQRTIQLADGRLLEPAE